MDPLLVGGALALGAILGSFLNAVLFRFNTGRSALSGRSQCMRCGHTLGALDLVPVLSWVLLRGRCRWCGTRISAQYPLVELLGALVSLGVLLTCGADPVRFVWGLLVWLVILFIVVYDFRHMIIPWQASIFLVFLTGVGALLPALAGHPLLAGPILAAPLFLLSLVSWGKWMGWADSIFELSLGWLLGYSLGASALLLSVWIGAAVGVCIMAVQKVTPSSRSPKSLRRFTMKSEIPFAPFLALGAALAFFFHVDIFATLFPLW